MLSTATKVRFARLIVSGLLSVGVAPVRRIRRRGIRYEVDFREGIDLSLFLFGTFQRHVLQTIRRVVPPHGTILDVGANVGAITLPAAAHLVEGRVYAFEPTDFAWRKLQRNLELNPQLAARVTPIRSFVAAEETAESSLVAYSSWPVLENGAELHPIHKGAAQNASCGQTTIDRFVAENDVASLSLLKIDTDGHEMAVLSGATETLARFRPVVLFEACEYLMKPPRATFDTFEELFRSLGYAIFNGIGGKPLSAEAFYSRCPRGGGLDLVALPSETTARA